MSAIVAFQLYDRLTQSLDHVKRDLGWLSRLVSDPNQLYNPFCLVKTSRRHYVQLDNGIRKNNV
jgi:hypothetical protein